MNMTAINEMAKSNVVREQGIYKNGISSISKNGLVRVDWSNLNEGLCGDYVPEDPEDINLLRFDCFVKRSVVGNWEVLNDSSYCTMIPATTDDCVLAMAAQFIAEQVADHLKDGSVKRLCEELSWISLTNIMDGTELEQV